MITMKSHALLFRIVRVRVSTLTPHRRLANRAMTTMVRPKVYVTRRVPPVGLELLRPDCDITQWNEDDPVPQDVLVEKVRGVDALFCLLTDKIDSQVLDAAGPQLKIVATMSVGYDHINTEECKKRNIPIGYTPDVLTSAVAEHTLALLLAASRRIKEGMKAVSDGEWGTWKPMWLCGQGLDGATVGIVGLGRIGMAIAQRLWPFGISRLMYTNLHRRDDESTVNAEFASFDHLLATSDFVLACCSLTPENQGLFNSEAFKKMKKTAIFVNTSRGGLVNQDDLCDALKSGTIQAASLDVTTPEPLPTNSPLLSLDNCVIVPHIASATEGARSAMSQLTAKNILAALRNEPLPAEVKL